MAIKIEVVSRDVDVRSAAVQGDFIAAADDADEWRLLCGGDDGGGD